MPIVGMYWGPRTNHDIHVLRGQSTRDLRHHGLKFRVDTNPAHDLDADVYLAQFADVTLTFVPIFKGAPQGGDFVGDQNGISVNMSTGVVTVVGTMPVNRKNNFILEAAATNTANASSFNETIRIHVHGSVSQVWISPSLLTVRKFGPPGTIVNTLYRFSVRALFDDKVMGDLTDGHGITWNEAGGHLNPEGKISVLHGDNAGDKFFVSATLPASLGGATTAAGPTLLIDRAWIDEPTPPTLEIVAGGGVPVTGSAENSINVLLVGDGFASGDADAFDQIADSIVHFLKSNTLTKPFNLFSGRMNFWKLMFPSEEMGISFRSELATSGTKPYALPVPAVKKPDADPPAPAPPTPWSIQNLLYQVGLPIAGDESAARTPAVLKAEWRKLLQADPTANIGPDPDEALVTAWKALARRVLVEEQNSFPGMSYGGVPAANTNDTTSLRLHEDRTGVQFLRLILSTLGNANVTLGDGRPVGALWNNDEPGFRHLNRDLVVLISSCPGGRAANYPLKALGHYVAVTSGPMSPYIPLRQVTGESTYVLDFPGVNANVEASAARVVAHELGHSFGLGDEYMETAGMFNLVSADAGQVNLQAQHDAEDAASHSLSGNEISWTWHRITAAAVLDQGNITEVTAGKFQIPVLPDVSFRFAQGDTVLLRKRAWKTLLQKPKAGDVSPALVVAAAPQIGSIVVSPAPGVNGVNLAYLKTFSAGSLIYAPKPAPVSVRSAAYPYAEMVAKNIKDAITTNKKPLTDVPCVFDPRNGPQIPIVDVGSDNRTEVKDLHVDGDDIVRVVGLYSGGATYSCGIFHPAGQCIMKNNLDAQSEFCAVCRYIMVDYLAPDFHAEIDADYEKFYPQR